MAPARSDEDGAGLETFAIERLAGRPAGMGAQVLGEDGREDRRHVLHDNHRDIREKRTDGTEHVRDGAGTTGGGADHETAHRNLIVKTAHGERRTRACLRRRSGR